ncbi:uncharacterized protein LOC106661677 [Cimex lectularius]|uniref:Uncharacterized protein n=1 Tax=Cimex lectularius TaxID=79782 RepID=A0A8I6RBE9_CIMLE|nr:uncharacterized protein LOC106661677 [Cimex lectularius]
MMNVLYVCLAITLFQGIQGFGGVDYQFEDGELEVNPHDFELMAANTQLLPDNEHCDNVSVTVLEMYKLGVRVTMWVKKSAGVLRNDVYNFYKCSGPGVVSCALYAFKKTKEDLLKLKPAFDEYKQDFTVLVVRLTKELPLCLH